MIGHLEKMFCDLGIPQTLLSDNAAQYGISKFRDFVKRMHMQHTTSSPRYPQSNGMAERMVQTMKRSLTKMLGDGKSLLQTLAAVRSMPIGDGLPSPAVLLKGQNLCTNLHQMDHMLRPQHINAEMVRRKLEERQSTAAYYHDAATSTFQRELHLSETMRMRQNGKWQSAIIRQHDQMPQSYWLETGSGSVLRRHLNQINKTASDSATPARDNSNDVSGERVCPNTTQSSGSVEQPPNNLSSHTVRSEEPTLCRSERASVRPKYLQDFVSS